MAALRLCAIANCGKPVVARALCRNHYAHARRRGEFDGRPVGEFRCRGACRFEGCSTEGKLRRGYCTAHYKRFVRHGDPAAGGTPMGVLVPWIEAHVGYSGDDCLIWPYARLPNGYCPVSFRGRRTGAHRVMCILAHGEPPTSAHEAAHSCGRGSAGCLNPRHLRWATKKENGADRVKHLAGPRGANHRSAKLSPQDVKNIRRAGRVTRQSQLAARYGISQSHVSRIINRDRAWSWLD